MVLETATSFNHSVSLSNGAKLGVQQSGNISEVNLGNSTKPNKRIFNINGQDIELSQNQIVIQIKEDKEQRPDSFAIVTSSVDPQAGKRETLITSLANLNTKSGKQQLAALKYGQDNEPLSTTQEINIIKSSPENDQNSQTWKDQGAVVPEPDKSLSPSPESVKLTSDSGANVKVDLAKDMLVIPFSGNKGETLTQYVNSGKLDKLGYEFVGVLGSGYTADGKSDADPRLGFIYQDGKVITNNLKQNPLRTGFKVMKDGSIERVTLTEGNEKLDEELKNLTSDPNLRSLFICDHGEKGSENTLAKWEKYDNGFRSTFMVFDENDKYLGNIRTKYTKTFKEQQEIVHKLYPEADTSKLVKLDGNGAAEMFFAGDNSGISNPAAMSYKNPLLVVRKKQEIQPVEQIENNSTQVIVPSTVVKPIIDEEQVKIAQEKSDKEEAKRDLADHGKVIGKFGNVKGEIIYNLAQIPWIRDRIIEHG